jgi:hypothetical protein
MLKRRKLKGIAISSFAVGVAVSLVLGKRSHS